MTQYLLASDGRTPVPVQTWRDGVMDEAELLRWARWMEAERRGVAESSVRHYWISTVFLGIDAAFGSGPPLLWETMVFRIRRGGHRAVLRKPRARRWHNRRKRRGLPDREADRWGLLGRFRSHPGDVRLQDWQNRYHSYEEALHGHYEAARMVRSLYG